MGMPMEGFFDGADIVAEAIAFTFVATLGVPVEASIPSPKPIPVEENTQAKRVGEFVPILVEIPTPRKKPLLQVYLRLGVLLLLPLLSSQPSIPSLPSPKL